MGGVPGSADGPSQSASALDPFEQEQRYVLTRAQALGFFEAIGTRASLDLYDRSRPVSFTRTTYLDTEDWSYFRSGEGDVARRLRIREYAHASVAGETPVLSGLCYLELKQHVGTARSKLRLCAPPALLRRFVAQAGRAPSDDPELAAIEPLVARRALQEELASARMAPCLTTWYRRTCLIAEGGRVRITLDESLLFTRPQPIGEAGAAVEPRDVIASGPSRVLEIKYWGEAPEWLAEAVEGLRAAPAFSKFHTGMLALAQHGAVAGLPVTRMVAAAPTLFVLAGPTA
jgi:hypothetical protein